MSERRFVLTDTFSGKINKYGEAEFYFIIFILIGIGFLNI